MDYSNFSLDPVLTLRRVLSSEEQEWRKYHRRKMSVSLEARNSTLEISTLLALADYSQAWLHRHGAKWALNMHVDVEESHHLECL